MDFKADALVIRTADYGESDKMVTLITAERGKIGAAVKGVRKKGARLAFAAQPFVFAEYVLAEKGGRYTVTQASLHEGFYELRCDIVKYYAAMSVLSALDIFCGENMEGEGYLVAAVKALRDIGGDAASALVAFLLKILSLAGYPVRAGACAVCGKEIEGPRYFDFAGGAFTCADCAAGERASESTYAAIVAAIRGERGTPDGNKRALRLLGAYIRRQADAEIGPLAGLLSLL